MSRQSTFTLGRSPYTRIRTGASRLTEWCSRGSKEDFDRLKELGVEMEGKIALVRYGGLFRGLKVKNSQDNGAIGTIIFTDPGDDGEYTVANGYEAYPCKAAPLKTVASRRLTESRWPCESSRVCPERLLFIFVASPRRSHHARVRFPRGRPPRRRQRSDAKHPLHTHLLRCCGASAEGSQRPWRQC